MKKIFILFFFLLGLTQCKTPQASTDNSSNSIVGDTVTIANEELEYQVIITDGGFVYWLNSRAFPRGYHTESFLENKNRNYVLEWNRRAMQPDSYSKNLYDMQINYDSSVKYGYEVNYLIYNYMIYFQNTFKQRLFGFVPPR